MWIPNEVRDHFKLGYTYTGLTPWDEAYQRNGSVDLDAYRKAIMRGINDKYGEVRRGALDVLDRANNAPPGIPSGSSHGAVAIAIADNGPATAIARSSGSGSTSVGPSPVPGGMKVTHGGQAIESNDFSISLRFSRFAFGGHPFAITVHLAPPPESGTTRDSGRDYIGSVYNFSQPAIVDGEEVCSNCTTLQRDDVKMSAYLPVNLLLAKLMEENGLSSLTKEDVSSVLGRLYWRVKRVSFAPFSGAPPISWESNASVERQRSSQRRALGAGSGGHCFHQHGNAFQGL